MDPSLSPKRLVAGDALVLVRRFDAEKAGRRRRDVERCNGFSVNTGLDSFSIKNERHQPLVSLRSAMAGANAWRVLEEDVVRRHQPGVAAPRREPPESG